MPSRSLFLLALAAGALAQDSSSGSSAAVSSSAASSASAASASSTASGSSSSNSSLIAYAYVNGSGITGSMTFRYLPGQGTEISGSLQGLPINETLAAAGNASTFPWHIHTNALNSSHSCASALGHLDPLFVTDGVACSSALPYYCQEGDMSGKHGRISTTNGSYEFSFVDAYVRWFPQDFSVLGRSVVIHSPNTTRLACGDVVSPIDGTANADGTPTNRSSTYQTAYASLGPPPVRTTVTPFVGTSTVSSAYTQIPMPYSLPAVSNGEIASLTLTTIASTVINGTSYTNYVRPTAFIVSSSTFNLAGSATSLPTASAFQYAPASAGTNSVAFTAGGSGGSGGASSMPSSGAPASFASFSGSLIGYGLAAVGALAGGALFVL